MNDIHPTAQIHPSVRELLKNRSFVYIGKGTIIEENVRIGNGVQIGSNCRIGKDSNFQANAVISDNTIIGERCFFAGFSCTADELYPSAGKQVRKPVTIHDDCIVGIYGLLIGVEMGARSVLGTHSKATRDIPPGQVWEGRPAKFKMTREDYDRKKERWESVAGG
jgi:acetyltransferase-like isoleucine patch superfamily enzyme